MTVPHTLQDQLAAALAKNKMLEIDLHMEKVSRLIAERKLTQHNQPAAPSLPDPREKRHD